MNYRDFYMQLVNPQHPVRIVPVRDHLVPAHPDYPDILLEQRAAAALQSLLARLDALDKIIPVSGFRSLKEQQAIWDDTMKSHGPAYTKSYVAIPGCSEHQTGLAIDLAANRPDIDFICPCLPYDGVYGEFRRLAPEYGFILRYPGGMENITHISEEPWHFRYIGTPHAQIITENGLVLEQYMQGARQYAS